MTAPGRRAEPSWLATDDLARELFQGVGLGAAVFGAALAGLCLFGASLETASPASAWVIASAALFDLTIALAQEGVFRGALLFWLRSQAPSRGRALPAAMTSSLAFAVIHLGAAETTPARLAGLFAFGMVASALTLRRSTIWPAVGFHAAWNLLLGAVLQGPGAPPLRLAMVIRLRDGLWDGGRAGFEGSPAVIALLALLAWRLRPCRGASGPDQGSDAVARSD